jgi:hypothetical protein
VSVERNLTLRVERLPHLTMKAASAPGNEPLLDRLPIGIHASGRGVFLYLGLPTARHGFQAFLGRHAKRSDPSRLDAAAGVSAFVLARVLPVPRGWFARSSKTRCTAISSELKWYLDELRTLPTEHLRWSADGAFRARQAGV